MGESVPKVSVIVPNYNHAPYLEQRLRSVLGQTYRDFELIYLDDYSPDASNAVYERVAASDPRSRAELNTTNSGSPFKQWNKGFRLAKGQYIWLAESDDWAEPQLLERLVELLDANPKVGVAYCQTIQVDAQGKPIKSMADAFGSHNRQRFQRDYINGGHDEIRQYLSKENTIPNASAALLRKSVLDEIGGANEDLRLTGDWMFWIKVLLHSDIAFDATPMNYWRTHSMTARAKRIADGLAESEEVIVIDYMCDHMKINRKEVMLHHHHRWAHMGEWLGNHKLARKHAMAALKLTPLTPYSWKLACRAWSRSMRGKATAASPVQASSS